MRENEKDYSQTMDLLFHLLSCVANDRMPDASLLADADLDALYKAALMNMVAASTCYALEKAGIHHEDFELKKAKALRLTALMEVEWNVVSAALDRAGKFMGEIKKLQRKDD